MACHIDHTSSNECVSIVLQTALLLRISSNAHTALKQADYLHKQAHWVITYQRASSGGHSPNSPICLLYISSPHLINKIKWGHHRIKISPGGELTKGCPWKGQVCIRTEWEHDERREESPVADELARRPSNRCQCDTYNVIRRARRACCESINCSDNNSYHRLAGQYVVECCLFVFRDIPKSNGSTPFNWYKRGKCWGKHEIRKYLFKENFLMTSGL